MAEVDCLRRRWELDELRAIRPPATEPTGFADWWRQRFRRTLGSRRPLDIRFRRARPVLRHWRHWLGTHRLLSYRSSDGFLVRGWIVLPRGPALRGLVLGHGYGGRSGIDTNYYLSGTVYLFPCCRGLGRSTSETYPAHAGQHVIHGLASRDDYILGGCVEDIWRGVSVLLELFPGLRGRIGYHGVSFGGGIGALAMAWDERIVRGHLGLPTFGHHPLRLSIPSAGSSRALARYVEHHPEALDVLRWYDAATAAQYLHQPVHCAPALCDPVVPPPGQFAVCNALAGECAMHVRETGHFEGPQTRAEWAAIHRELRDWFGRLG